jgi:hypothetical protein
MVALYHFFLQSPVSIVIRDEGKKLPSQQVEPISDSSESFWVSHDAILSARKMCDIDHSR